MPKKMLVLFAMFVAVATGTAQITGPKEVTAPPGRLAMVEVTADADEADYRVEGDIDAFREYSPVGNKLRIRFLGSDGTVGYLFVAGVKGGKLLPVYSCKIIIGRPPEPFPPEPRPPEPKPPEPRPPDPKPPEPVPVVDPLVKSFRDAAYTDSLPLAKLRDLADAFTAASVVASRSGTTVGVFQDSLTNEIVNRFMPLKDLREKFPTVRKVIQDQIAAMDSVIPPSKPEPLLTESQREYAAGLFAKIAKAAMEASR